MRAVNLTLLLLALLWAAPAQALDWWVEDQAQAQALEDALAQLWPEHRVVVRQGAPPVEGDAVWVESGTLVLRHDGGTRRAEQLGELSTRVVLVRSWMEAGLVLPPPPPPPHPREAHSSWAPHALHAAHLLPGAGAGQGAELAVSAVGTGTLDTDPLEGAARGYAPVVSAAAGFWRLRTNATVWNLWEPARTHRPMGVAGVSVLVVERDRWRMAPWVGAAGGWKRENGTVTSDPGQPSSAFSAAASQGLGGVVGTGVALEVSGDRFAWDLSLPIAGWMVWQTDPDPRLTSLSGPAWKPALLLPYPEAGISWRLTDADTMRFGLLASVPSIRWRHDQDHAFFEISAATSIGLGQLGDGDLLLGGAVQGRVGVQL